MFGRNLLKIFQGEQGEEDWYRPGEGQRGEEAGRGAGDDHSLQHSHEEHRQPGIQTTLFGRGLSRSCALIGVMMVLMPALSCRKDTAQGTQSPLLGAFLVFPCVFMAGSGPMRTRPGYI